MSARNPQYPTPVEVGVVIVAAGSGQRLGHGIPKARVLCGGRPLLDHAVDAVLRSDVATAVVAVLPEDDDVLAAVVAEAATRYAGRTHDTAGTRTPVRISSITGGSTRTASVRAGIDALPPTIGIVLVHDAARALTPPAVFRRVASAVADGAPAVVPVLPVVDTVKVVDGDLVTATPDRAALRAVQTPQGFDAVALRAAHAGDAAAHPGITDDAMLMEALGHAVHVVEGDPLAFKVTTPLDLVIAEAVLAQESAGSIASPGDQDPGQEPDRDPDQEPDPATIPTTSRSSRVPE
ncbi:2-C-methyl-D-erythritol 4-phosphate cytidylyltransferase [Arthrobacter pityocampae]|uniref:2-C-methyl-D-erythritol 4-phosphate cytidylyltransferase n=1 Tax=Arthrobacter pityocampae TaxID=547334 RepID=A0A2S5IU82_9MICC|nr:2-C-methyl-D-erythritol 4-phosphate cytidylyltransferase [Arthrobacter pityocampae]PPB48105.1 2-C-methyl-D-erythritol 4-phosphate cytidylyltransferase [Arthrobacter pityocampae]